MKEDNIQAEKKYNIWIVILSVVIPIVVAILFGVNLREMGFDVEPLSFLPPIYASINAVTALVLVLAFIAIQNKKINLHKRLMQFAIFLSLTFLVMYVAYHMTSDSTKFGGEGIIKYVYFFILITHILMSVIVIPFVLITYVRAITNNIERHKKIAKITFPLWLYVAITGVVVYIMISPYYV
jgi:putative membrane protein